MINNSVMKCCICNNEKMGEFITINDNKYHLCCIENLHQENQQLHNKIDKAIELIKNKTKIIPLEEGGGLELCDYDVRDLLEILKDSDVDE